MAPGSVMKDPNSGPIVRIVNHHADGVLPPSAATRCSTDCAKATTGRVDAIAMMTTTNIGSTKCTREAR